MEKLPDNPSIRIESQIRGSQRKWDGRIAYGQFSMKNPGHFSVQINNPPLHPVAKPRKPKLNGAYLRTTLVMPVWIGPRTTLVLPSVRTTSTRPSLKTATNRASAQGRTAYSLDI